MSNRPMAVAGLLSYRYPSGYGWIMIGALDDQGALSEANRSLCQGAAVMDRLERWDATANSYVPA